jgi:hypothetical protein
MPSPLIIVVVIVVVIVIGRSFSAFTVRDFGELSRAGSGLRNGNSEHYGVDQLRNCSCFAHESFSCLVVAPKAPWAIPMKIVLALDLVLVLGRQMNL